MMLWIAFAGGIGALARWLVTAWFAGRSRLGTGTAILNALGALGLGVVAGLGRTGRLRDDIVVIAGVGLLGSLTTFSTWMVETAEAAHRHTGRTVTLRTIPLMALGMALAWLGLMMAGVK